MFNPIDSRTNYIGGKAFWAGFFSIFGFQNDEMKEKVEKAIDPEVGEKIRRDIRSVNADFKKAYLNTRSKVYELVEG